MLTDLKSILALAEEKGCAIPAFNCYTQECVMGVLEAAKETGAPVIFQMFSRLADTNDGNDRRIDSAAGGEHCHDEACGRALRLCRRSG